jgi:hypothetical protein
MPQRTIHDDVQAALKRLDAEDPGLKQMLKKAYGYAVFPSVGKAALVIGGAYGRGEVYERGKPVGYATIAQTTIGVQVGGDTFTEVLVFRNKEALDRFKAGKMAFAANASAVLVKAGAGGTADYEKGVAAYAYSQGGMMLEAAIGGQKFHFQEVEEQEEGDEEQAGAQGRRGARARGGSRREEGGEEEQGEEAGAKARGVLGSATDGLKNAASKTSDLVKEHPVAATLIGTGVLAGLGLLVMRAVRKSGATSEVEDTAEDESDQEEERLPEDEYEDQAEDYDEGEEESGEGDREDDDSGVDEVEDAPRYSRARARS